MDWNPESLSLSYFQVNYLCFKRRNVSVCKFYDSAHAWGVSAGKVYKLLLVIRVGTQPVDIVSPLSPFFPYLEIPSREHIIFRGFYIRNI